MLYENYYFNLLSHSYHKMTSISVSVIQRVLYLLAIKTITDHQIFFHDYYWISYTIAVTWRPSSSTFFSLTSPLKLLDRIEWILVLGLSLWESRKRVMFRFSTCQKHGNMFVKICWPLLQMWVLLPLLYFLCYFGIGDFILKFKFSEITSVNIWN